MSAFATYTSSFSTALKLLKYVKNYKTFVIAIGSRGTFVANNWLLRLIDDDRRSCSSCTPSYVIPQCCDIVCALAAGSQTTGTALDNRMSRSFSEVAALKGY